MRIVHLLSATAILLPAAAQARAAEPAADAHPHHHEEPAAQAHPAPGPSHSHGATHGTPQAQAYPAPRPSHSHGPAHDAPQAQAHPTPGPSHPHGAAHDVPQAQGGEHVHDRNHERSHEQRQPTHAVPQEHGHGGNTAGQLQEQEARHQPAHGAVRAHDGGHGQDHGEAGARSHGQDRGMAHADGHAGMDMKGMKGALGAYSMMRDASGTAWQPDSAPMSAIMGRAGDWSTMVHGFLTLIHDDQGGPRGDSKTFSTSMLMGMAQRPLGQGTLTLRAMGSADPLIGKSGYPLLLATGETADGRTGLVDRQHPHDAFMELAATYSHPIGNGVSGFVYLGLPGEPALGPATYMHRFSGMASPEAPIAHHWLDATHVTFGVATIGLTYKGLKLEGSVFTGREPDQHRWNIERPRMDSWSVRATVNPTENLSAQLSHGFLKSPEGLHPELDMRRTTASVTWNLPLGVERNWQSTFAWGRNDPSQTGAGHSHGHSHMTDAFLFDTALQLGRWTGFGRIENVDKGELFGDGHDGDPLAGRVFNVTKVSLGGYHAFPLGGVALDVGGLVSKYDLPGDIKPRYGSNPTSFMLFTRLRITG